MVNGFDADKGLVLEWNDSDSHEDRAIRKGASEDLNDWRWGGKCRKRRGKVRSVPRGYLGLAKSSRVVRLVINADK